MDVPELPLNGVRARMTYTFDYRFDGKILYTAKHEFADDLEALDTAERLAETYEIEIWRDDRFVARIKAGNESLNVRDRRSG